MKRLLLFFIFLFCFLALPKATFADNKFNTTYDVTYNVNQSGITHTVANIAIQNTTSNYYVSSYSLKLGFNHINNLHASDPNGPIVPVIKTTNEGEEIDLQFNTVVYGTGTTLPFTISFDTPDIASKNGQIWEVNIPGLNNQNDFSQFNVNVAVPQSFGNPTYIKPVQPSASLHFTKDQLGKSGISIAFGNAQTYQFNLAYHLQNKNVFPIKTEIALPPSTNYQEVFLDSLDPKPTNVKVDKDGNWLAEYLLLPSQTKTVIAQGSIAVSLLPQESILSEKDRETYLQQQQYWELSNTDIASLGKELKTPEAIYNYIVSHLTYDFSRVNANQQREGAAGVLHNPTSAVCLEFTDLFVALSRAAGIPAREIDGYAYTQNTKERPLSLVKDVLHAWPEYYDDATHQWIMVDPTWGNTTGGVDYFHVLDFDHIAFVIKGASSVYPVPAGGYKLPGQQSQKDIMITFGSPKQDFLPTVDMGLSMGNTYLSAFPIGGKVVLKNTGTVLFPQQTLSITTSHLTPSSQNLTISPIPPFGSVEIPVRFTAPFLTNEREMITIALAGKSISKIITVTPVSTQQLLIGGGITFGIFCIIISIIAARTRRVSIPR